MKNYFYRPPAFKSDVGKKPTEGANKDLYLKGQDYYSSKAVNFDETMTLQDDRSGSAGKTEHIWQLTIYKSGTTKFGSTGRGEGTNYADDNIKCDSKPFEVTQWTYGNGDSEHDSWDKAVADVKFELENCKQIGGRKTCDIKIE